MLGLAFATLLVLARQLVKAESDLPADLKARRIITRTDTAIHTAAGLPNSVTITSLYYKPDKKHPICPPSQATETIIVINPSEDDVEKSEESPQPLPPHPAPPPAPLPRYC